MKRFLVISAFLSAGAIAPALAQDQGDPNPPTLEKNGQLVSTAAGAAVMGHPAAAVAWLVRKLAERGQGLKAGHVVMCGALTEAVAVQPGDSIVARFDRLGTVEIACR